MEAAGLAGLRAEVAGLEALLKARRLDVAPRDAKGRSRSPTELRLRRAQEPREALR